jgi:hypothetical protein
LVDETLAATALMRMVQLISVLAGMSFGEAIHQLGK